MTAYVEAWRDMRRSSCEATHVRHTQSMALFDLRTACLDRRRAEVQALVGRLAQADAAVVARAVEATAGLTALAACEDAEALTQAVPPPDDPEARRRVDELRDRLAEARALRATGAYVEGRELALEVVAAAAPIAYGPLTAEALVLAGELQLDAGDPSTAEQTLLAAVRAASGAARDDLLAQAWIDLVHVIGVQLGRHEEAEHWRRVAELAVLRVADPPRLRAELLSGEGALLRAGGAYGPALARFREALALREAALPGDDPALATSLTNVGNAARSLAAFTEALAYHERALSLRVRVLGPDHPEVAEAHHHLALSLDDLGRHGEALAQHTRALEVARLALPAGHPTLASIEMSVGTARQQAGDLAAARVHFDAVLQAWTATLGPDHPDLALIHSNLGGLAFRAGDMAAALRHGERAATIFERAFGAEHPPLAGALDLVGMCHDRLGDPTLALAMFERAMALRTTHLPADHPELAMSHGNLASALYALGRRDEALTHDVAALAIAERTHGADHELLIGMHDNLGLSLLELGRAEEALVHYRRALAVAERVCGECPAVVVPLTGVGEALVALGRPREATPMLQRALAQAGTGDPIDVAAARFALARALWSDRGERTRATALAGEARAVYADGGATQADRRAEVERWLAAHRR